MKHYMVFLTNGETVHVWADNADLNESLAILKFNSNLRYKAIFNVNNICGFMRCDKEGDEE